MEVTYCKDYDEKIKNLKMRNRSYCYTDRRGATYYYRRCSLHRIGGPATEFCDGKKWWYLFDVNYKENEYNKLIKNIPLLYWKNRHNL